MNKKRLNNVFKQIKERTKMDYAITNTDDYGDCNCCVNSELSIEFGIDSTGIYVKHWLTGMNKGKPYKELEGVYISHDITEEQAKTMIDVFVKNGYDIQPQTYDASKAFYVKEMN